MTFQSHFFLQFFLSFKCCVCVCVLFYHMLRSLVISTTERVSPLTTRRFTMTTDSYRVFVPSQLSCVVSCETVGILRTLHCLDRTARNGYVLGSRESHVVNRPGARSCREWSGISAVSSPATGGQHAWLHTASSADLCERSYDCQVNMWCSEHVW